jgi:hypothetical protein
VPAGRYAPKHVAALYFADVAGTCRRDVVSLSAFGRDLGAGRLPSLAVVVPDLCDDGHDCSDRHADGWLGGFLRQVVASRSYRAGDTAVLVTFDEGGGGFGGQNCPRVRDESCHVALVALAPSVRAGTRMTVLADHRALPRLVEDLLVLQVHLAASSRLPRVRAALGL